MRSDVPVLSNVLSHLRLMVVQLHTLNCVRLNRSSGDATFQVVR
jgi:hypothetical protein